LRASGRGGRLRPGTDADRQVAGARLAAAGLDVETVASLPLRRAVETAALAWQGKPLVLLEDLRERHSGQPTDCRRSRSELAALVREEVVRECAEGGGGPVQLDLSALDGEVDPLRSASREPFSAAEARARRALVWLMARPERSLAVVSHGWLLRQGIFGPGCRSVLRFSAAPPPSFGLAEPHVLAVRRETPSEGEIARFVARPLKLGLDFER